MPEIEVMLLADHIHGHGEQLGNADDERRGHFAADPLPQRVSCGWCSGTGRVQNWNGWALVGTKNCVRCAGRGFVCVESGDD